MKRVIYILVIFFSSILSSEATNIDVSCDFESGLCNGYGNRSGNAFFSTIDPIFNDNYEAINGVSGTSDDDYLGLRYDIVTTKSTSNKATVDYNLDLENVTNYTMAFWYILTDHSHHSGTGIYMSDDGGSSFTKIFNLERDEEVWHPVQLDLNSLATQNGLTMNDQAIVRIKYEHDGSPPLGTGIGIDNLVLGTSTCDNNDISISQNLMPHLGGVFWNGWYGTTGNISIDNTTVLSGTKVIVQCGNSSSITLEPGFISENGSNFIASCDYSCNISFKSAVASNKTMMLKEKEDFKIDLSPNPSQGNLTLIANKKIGRSRIQIFDTNGQMIHEMEQTIEANNTLNLKHLSSGLYFIKINSEIGLSVHKIIIN